MNLEVIVKMKSTTSKNLPHKKKKKQRKNNVEREDGAEISNNKKGLSWNENTEDAVIF